MCFAYDVFIMLSLVFFCLGKDSIHVKKLELSVLSLAIDLKCHGKEIDNFHFLSNV
jgi:hypothetical protein